MPVVLASVMAMRSSASVPPGRITAIAGHEFIRLVCPAVGRSVRNEDGPSLAGLPAESDFPVA